MNVEDDRIRSIAELLPGFILIDALTYQLILLRVGFDVVTRRNAQAWRAAVAVAIALVVGPLLVAIQLLPAAELVRDSARATVSAADILREGHFPLAMIRDFAHRRLPPIPLSVVPLLAAAIAPLHRRLRRQAVFLFLAAGLYAVLGLEDATPLFRLYMHVPPGMALLRFPVRLFWVTGFCLALLTALGIDALAAGDERTGRRKLGLIGTTLVAVGVLYLTAGGLRRPETWAMAAAVVAVVTAAVRPVLRQPAAGLVVAAVTLNLIAVPLRWGRGTLLPSIDPYWRHAATFAALDPPVTAQDRVMLVPDVTASLRYTLIQKTSTLLQVPGIYDFEHLLGLRAAQYVAMMRRGRGFDGLTDAYAVFPMLTPTLRRRLIDAAAVRYVVVSSSIADADRLLEMPRIAVDAPDLHVYLNPSALSRVRWVPHVEVVPDADALLWRLAYGDDDLSAVALVEQPPPSGPAEVDGSRQTADVRLVRNDPEHLVIDIDAPRRGFLVIADQYERGWRASVNGVPAPVLRANYLFRLIEVPAGSSRAEFRYRPTSLVLGAIVSGTALLGAGVVVSSGRRRRA